MPLGGAGNYGQRANVNSYGQGAYGSGAQAGSTGEKRPKKFVSIDGVMQRNPAYDEFMAREKGQAMPTPKEQHERALALPIVANMEEHAAFNEASKQTTGQARPLAFSTNQTIEMMQDEDFARNVGLDTDETVEALGDIFAKHEIPMGLMNKLMMLSEYDKLEFIIDDSGSMNSETKAIDSHGRRLKDDDGQNQTRWGEAKGRLKELVEILAYVPTNEVSVVFFNRANRVNLSRDGSETPSQFIHRANMEIDRAFNAEKPRYRTPALRVLQDSIRQNQGKSVSRYFFCDGEPDGRSYEVDQIKNLIKNRDNAKQNPITFMSCSEEDDEVEWMKELEEVAPYAAEYDDYESERNEVISDQGVAFPFNKGFYLIGSLVAAMNPDDLDAMDESVPFTKATLDNVLGYETQPEEYGRYFQQFEIAQSKKVVNNEMDRVKKNQNWGEYFNDFVQAPVAKHIPVVQDFQAQLQRASNGGSSVSNVTNQFSRLGGIGGASHTPAPRYGQSNNYGASPYAQGAYGSNSYGQNQQTGSYSSQGYRPQQQGGSTSNYQYQSPNKRRGIGSLLGRRKP